MEEQFNNILLLKNEKVERIDSFKILILLATIFMFITAAFVSTQNMLITIYSKLGLQLLGSISIFVLYTGLIIGGFFTPFIVSRLSLKKSLYIFSYSYVVLVGAGYLTSLCHDAELVYCFPSALYIINISSMLFCGLFCGNCLLAGASYVDAISLPSNKSKFFGTFFSIQLSSQVVGNFLATILIGIFSEGVFFLTTLIMSVISANCFLICPSVKKPVTESQETLEFSNSELPTITKTIKNVFSQFTCPLMQKVMVICLNNGMTNGAYICFLYKIVNTCLDPTLSDHDKNFYTALVFIVLGCGSIIGGYISAKLGDSYDTIFMNEIAVMFGEYALLMMLVGFLQKSYIICCISGGIFGLADTSQQSGINILISQEKPHLECFSFFRMMQGFGIIVSGIFAYMIQDQSLFYIFFLVIFIFQLITISVISSMQVKKKRERFF